MSMMIFRSPTRVGWRPSRDLFMADKTAPPPKPGRSIRLIRAPDRDGVGVFCVTVGGDNGYYVLRELPCLIGGRGFEVHRLGLGNLYHVRVGKAEECSCECNGFLYRGQCRHVLGLLALVREGKL
jgi:SWIM zinc finger